MVVTVLLFASMVSRQKSKGNYCKEADISNFSELVFELIPGLIYVPMRQCLHVIDPSKKLRYIEAKTNHLF